MRKQWKWGQTLFSWAPKSLQMVTVPKRPNGRGGRRESPDRRKGGGLRRPRRNRGSRTLGAPRSRNFCRSRFLRRRRKGARGLLSLLINIREEKRGERAGETNGGGRRKAGGRKTARLFTIMTESRVFCKRFFPLFAKTAVFLADKALKTRAATDDGAGFDGRGEFSGETSRRRRRRNDRAQSGKKVVSNEARRESGGGSSFFSIFRYNKATSSFESSEKRVRTPTRKKTRTKSRRESA